MLSITCIISLIAHSNPEELLHERKHKLWVVTTARIYSPWRKPGLWGVGPSQRRMRTGSPSGCCPAWALRRGESRSTSASPSSGQLLLDFLSEMVPRAGGAGWGRTHLCLSPTPGCFQPLCISLPDSQSSSQATLLHISAAGTISLLLESRPFPWP